MTTILVVAGVGALPWGCSGAVRTRWLRQCFASLMIGLNFSGFLSEERQNLGHAKLVFREPDGLDGLHSNPKVQPACCVRVQDCAIAHHAPRMLAPDIVRSEVVVNSDGSAQALEPEDRRVPMTLVRTASADVYSVVCE
jgi:hypothetical protein